jgi:hypothetical protein
MAEEQKGMVAAGFSLLWRRQSVLWWVFVVNLVCGVLGALPAAVPLAHALSQSLAAQKLSHGFDLAIFEELVRLPDMGIWRYTTGAWVSAFLFVLFMLFVTGGILETYRQDRRLATGDFFAASGAFFWRLVRLLLLSIIPFVIVGFIHKGLSKLADHIGDRAIADQVGIFLGWAAMIIFLLLALWVRLWFDIAQVRAVAQNERRMWRNLWKSWSITWHDVGRLFGMYFVIALLAWIALAVGIVIWSRLPPTATPLTFLLLELIMFAQLTTRLWQLASAMTWYRHHAESVVAADPVMDAIPAPAEVVEMASAPDLPPASLGPELPPADA